MLINKITDGFVIQTYDTETNKWTEQQFIAGDSCELEDTEGNCLEDDFLVRGDKTAPYLPFDMVQTSANGLLTGQH